MRKVLKLCFVFFACCSVFISLVALTTFGNNFNSFSLKDKIGQKIILDIRYLDKGGTAITNINSRTRPIIERIFRNYRIGGIILFSENFKTKEQAKKLISDLKCIAKECALPELFICTDQEGGIVERFSFGRDRLKNNIYLTSEKEAFEKGKRIGNELRELGINLDFAPVLDVNSNPKNKVIGKRAFGSKKEVVSLYGAAFIKGLHEFKIAATAKHFPGHGDTSVDSHIGLPVIQKSKSELEFLELVPFKSAISAGVDAIMTAHISLPKIESTKYITKDGKEIFIPATLSKTVLTGILRKEMNFEGVIITDAMNMGAISLNFPKKEAVRMAVEAGADIVLMPVTIKNGTDFEKLDEIYSYLTEYYENNELAKKDLENSFLRILKLKEKYCVS